ncbi:hypothetical protein LPJ74_000270 [Coemansia sp. RSA 1843]|nr:hypothetical protein LPJ74_000270 [Coemansia sp. RSA 1843]
MAAETSNGGGIAIIVICSLLLTLNFACLIYCFWKRNYLPLKACNMTNMNLTYTSMVMTFIGSVNIAGFSVCAVFGFILLALGRINFSDDKLALAGILKIFFIVVPQQIYFYMNLGPTIYHLFIHANEYNDKFINTIEERGLAQVYELVCKCPLGEISNMSAEGKTRGISMDGSEAGSDCGSEYSVSSNFSGNVPGPDNNQPQHPAHHTQTSPNGQTLPFYSI